VTGCVVNAQAPCAPDRKATSAATAISILFIGPPRNEPIVDFPAGLSSPLNSNDAQWLAGAWGWATGLRRTEPVPVPVGSRT
jgi:hypothetical protein